MSYSKAKRSVDGAIESYINMSAENGTKGISRYASVGYKTGLYTEVVAESFASKDTNKISKDIITIFDDIDIETGTMKIRKKGGAGTHNGMKSMVKELNTTDFPRVRVGTGKQEKIADLVDYVIGRVDDEEYKKLEIGVEKAEVAVEEILKIGIDNAMNRLN